MIGFDGIFERLPSWVFTGLGAVSVLAFLAGPLALMTFGVRGWAGGVRHSQARLPAAVLLSLLSITVAAVTSTASLFRAFLDIAETGRGGSGIVASAGAAAAQSLFHGALAVVACLVAVAAFTVLRRGDDRPQYLTELAPMSSGLAVGLAVLLALALMGVDGLLRFHQALMNSLIAGLTTAQSAGLSARLADIAGTTIVGGGLLTLVLLGTGLATWRASRARRPHQLLVWTSTVALVMVIGGAVWHASRVKASLDSYHDATRRANAAAAPLRR